MNFDAIFNDEIQRQELMQTSICNTFLVYAIEDAEKYPACERFESLYFECNQEEKAGTAELKDGNSTPNESKFMPYKVLSERSARKTLSVEQIKLLEVSLTFPSKWS